MSRITLPILFSSALAAAIFAGCVGQTSDEELYGTATGGTLSAGIIKQEGSSTVLPLAERWAEEFGEARGVQIAVKGGGSGRGITGLCTKELDVGDASRQIKQSEREGICADNNVDPVEWWVAYDGLSVVVSKKNTFIKDLTVEQLAMIFTAEGFATTWNQVDESFPNQAIKLCYPDDDSGTYEYFNEAILDGGEPRKGGNNVQQNADDNVLVNCLKDDQNAIGYFGFAYVIENTDKVKPVKVGGVEPTFETIADGSYKPLSRPIYIYTDGIPTGIVKDYVAYIMHPEGGQALIEEVGYVALDENARLRMVEQLEG